MHVPCVNAWIDEAALHDKYWELQRGPFDSNQSRLAPMSIYRNSLLLHLINSNKEFMTAFIDIPTSQMLNIGISTWSKSCHILIVALKAIFIGTELPGEVSELQISGTSQLCYWDSIHAAEESDLVNLASLLQVKLDSVTSDLVSAEGDRDAMFQTALSLKTIMTHYEKHLQAVHMKRNAGNLDSHNSSEPSVNGSYVESDLSAGMPSKLLEGQNDAMWDNFFDDFTVFPFP
jgi:hypothetical protein